MVDTAPQIGGLEALQRGLNGSLLAGANRESPGRLDGGWPSKSTRADQIITDSSPVDPRLCHGVEGDAIGMHSEVLDYARAVTTSPGTISSEQHSFMDSQIKGYQRQVGEMQYYPIGSQIKRDELHMGSQIKMARQRDLVMGPQTLDGLTMSHPGNVNSTVSVTPPLGVHPGVRGRGGPSRLEEFQHFVDSLRAVTNGPYV